MARTSLLSVATALAFLSSAADLAVAQVVQTAVEPHALYETKCMGCHNEHGADLARQRLSVVGEALHVNRTGTTIEQLLGRHHGVKLTAVELATLTRLFRSGIQWGGAFQLRCARCHDKGVTFARSKLTLRSGEVWTLKGDKDVAEFLTRGHGEATATEVETLIEMFRYQLETAPK